VGKLEAKTIKNLPIGKYCDGDGLWLRLSKPGRGSWILRYQRSYVPRQMGIGAYPLIGLDKARAAALKARLLIHDGIDPLGEKTKAAVKIPTFGEFSKSVIEAQTVGVSAKHAAQWSSSLVTYASSLSDKRVDAIETEHVLAVLQPIWTAKSETADRVRNRVERVLDAATARKFRTGPNPARWRGHLDKLLGKRQRTGAHHAALDYRAVPQFAAKLREKGGAQATAIEFLVLSACRLSEVLDAVWSEFDLDGKVFTIPPGRMKAKKEHRVPLSGRCCQVLAEIERKGDRVFNVSPRAVQNKVKSLDPAATAHGFRSSFRDWCADVAHAPREIAEEALAHAVGNQVERAYRRSDALERRRQLMDAWAAYVGGEACAEVVDLASRRA
jgi:integrase